jgi:hypothetical protein
LFSILYFGGKRLFLKKKSISIGKVNIIMDVRQRGTVSNNAAQRSMENSSNNTGMISRTSSKINPKNYRASMRIIIASICLGITLAILIVSLGMLTGIISLTDSEPSGTNQQLIRGAMENQASGAIDPVQQMEFESLKQQNKELLDKLMKLRLKTEQQLKEKIDKKTDETQLTTRISRLLKDRERLHEMIQLISKRHLIEKYGIGPHYVEILLSFDPQSNIADKDKINKDDTAILLIEMAPISEMPSTVLWFLEQVNATIYDGCSFHRNAHHVVQGGPIANFETKDNGKSVMQKIRTTGLDSIPFQE